MHYNWEHPNWPHFQYTTEKIQKLLYSYAKKSGELIGILKTLDQSITQEATLDRMVNEALCTSKIEGELLNPEDIRSSIQHYLHPEQAPFNIGDAKALGVSKLMSLLYQNYTEDLSLSTLLEWHSVLFEHQSYAYLHRGQWRKNPEPMQIVSGPIGQEKVYFEAPPSSKVPLEMERFIDWFNASSTRQLPGPIRAGIAHLYFESIHPFEDGNGRIGRAIAELALSQDMEYPCIFSVSKLIQHTQKRYYQELSSGSSYTLNITPWLTYFTETIYAALNETDLDIQFILKKANFWKTYSSLLNPRQEKVVRRMLDEGRRGFEGGMNARKYMIISGCSKATATRDLSDLLHLGILVKLDFGGRSTAYELNLETH